MLNRQKLRQAGKVLAVRLHFRKEDFGASEPFGHYNVINMEVIKHVWLIPKLKFDFLILLIRDLVTGNSFIVSYGNQFIVVAYW